MLIEYNSILRGIIILWDGANNHIVIWWGKCGANVGQMALFLENRKTQLFVFQVSCVLLLRSVADLNCCTRFCRPLPNRSANRPYCDFAVQRYTLFVKCQTICPKLFLQGNACATYFPSNRGIEF